MKLLIITQKYSETDDNLGIFFSWWDRLAEKIERVYVLALEKRSEPKLSNVEVFSLGKEKKAGRIAQLTAFYRQVFRLTPKIDGFFIHMVPLYVFLVWPVAKIYRKPIFMWYTGVAAHWKLKLAVILSDKIFTAHEAAMRVDTDKRIIIGHGIDTGKFKVQSSKIKNNGEITILSVGRITPSKGHDFVINAIADIIKSGYNLKLKIIGGVIQSKHKLYQEYLLKLVEDLGLKSQVEFVGPVSYQHIDSYFNNADILINAVPFGGLDKVVLEAMASGVIAFTSNEAFLTVFPQEWRDRFIYKKDSQEDLLGKLKFIFSKKLWEDEILKSKLREIVVRNHSLERLWDLILPEIERII